MLNEYASPRGGDENPAATKAPVTRRLNPRKLLLSKWTAARPSKREKHFLVVRVIAPEPPSIRIDCVELEAIHSGRRFSIRWRELADSGLWLQGWL